MSYNSEFFSNNWWLGLGTEKVQCFSNGNLETFEKLDKAGLRHGQCYQYHDNGNIDHVSEWEHGKFRGIVDGPYFLDGSPNRGF